MLRRTFILSSTAFLATPALAQTSYSKVRLSRSRFSGKNKSYNYKRMNDPTGQAPTRKIERFELRGGDCSNTGDCTPRPLNGRQVTRTRIERVQIAKLREGDEGLFRYHVYFPSAEYNHVPSVGSTMGQLLWNFERNGSGDSTPIFSLDTDWKRDGPLEAVMMEVRAPGNESTRDVANQTTRIGSFARNKSLFDRWHQVDCLFQLSTGRDGYLESFFNGKSMGRLSGRTMTSGGTVEIRYGIYQTGTNQYPGGREAMPTQVVYFSGVSLHKKT